MSDEYTPDSFDVRAIYAGGVIHLEAQFDRWLAAHDREVEARGASNAYGEARRILRGEFEPLVARKPDWRNVDGELARAAIREGI